MSIVLNPFNNPDEWREHLERLLPDETFVMWPDVDDPQEVDLAVAWVLPRADVRAYPNLKAILSLGAGAEQWQREGMPDVDIVRLADPGMSDEMATYALHWVIHLQRGFDRTDPLQRAGRYEIPDSVGAAEFPVGILGHGTIGARVGRAFSDLGYPVNAWTRSGGHEDGVAHFAGLDELDAFLAASMAVVNVLPSTTATTGLLTRE
ncbi:MAG: NAD(P)-dependent oxidoreductase, partial [Acidimicrobiales bacterium]